VTDLPEPLTPADCDLRDFQYMELDVQRLRDSKFSATPKGDAFRAGVLLWCAAWHQVPAASVPDDDVELANLAGFGRMPFSVREWRKLRTEALTGFVKCSDGRLYHTVIAEKALTAWESRKQHAYDKLGERIRKENKRRAEHKQLLLQIPTYDLWKSGAVPVEIPAPPPSVPPEVSEPSAGIPAENALKGNGEGEGTERERNGEGDYSVPTGTGAAAPPAPAVQLPGVAPAPTSPPAEVPTDDNAMAFALGVPWLMAHGTVAERNARSLLAKLVTVHTAAVVLGTLHDGVRAAESGGANDRVSWLTARLDPNGKRKPANRQTDLEDRNRAAVDAVLRKAANVAG
jgi:hypothetical protein